MEGMLFALTFWARGPGAGWSKTSFRVPCNCVLEAVSLSAANVNDAFAEIEIREIVPVSNPIPGNGAVAWLDRTTWDASWIHEYGPNVRMYAGELAYWSIKVQNVAPVDVMMVLYFREG